MKRLITTAVLAGCRLNFDDVSGRTGDAGPDAHDGAFADATLPCTFRFGAGRLHTAAVMPDQTMRVWGDSQYGQIGDGFMTDRSSPTLIDLGGPVVSASAGRYETCAALASGQAYCWGEGTSGQLGNNAMQTRATPVPVSTLTTAVEIGAAAVHACARLSSGQVWCWGDGSSGRLGTGGTASSNVPVMVTGISTAKVLSMGGSTACVILADDTARCWGYNQEGGCGVGSMSDVLSPMEPMGLGTVRSISPRDSATCAVRGDGSVHCWGKNAVGQTGTGSIGANILVPQPVVDAGMSPLVGGDEVGQGIDSGCARLGTEVWCWGRNDSGQLGDGSPAAGHPYAVKVPGLPPIVQLGVAAYSACALAADGGVWCWGLGSDGELGNGMTTTKISPALSFTACP